MVVQGEPNQSSDCSVNLLSFRTARSQSTAPADIGWVEKSSNPPSSQNSSFTWHFKVPSWMTTKGLELAGLRAPDGWKFAFRAYNTISADSMAIRFVVTSNIQGLQDLFASRQASPFDRVYGSGFTLLHVSTLCGSNMLL
jgi:hypothetical protein